MVGSARTRGTLLRVDAQLVHVGGATRGATALAMEAGTPAELVQGIDRRLRRELDVPGAAARLTISRSPEALAAFHRAGEHLARGDTLQAEPELEQAVAADPEFGAAWYKLAEVCEAAGKRERALTAVDRAIATLAGSDRLAALARARQARLRGEPEAALQVLRGLVDRFPNDLETAVALADAYGQSGKLTEARQVLAGVVTAAPNHPRAWFLLGKYAILAGESR